MGVVTNLASDSFFQSTMEVGEPETGSSSPGGVSKDSASHASNEFDSGIETMEVDDATEKAAEKRKRTSSRWVLPEGFELVTFWSGVELSAA